MRLVLAAFLAAINSAVEIARRFEILAAEVEPEVVYRSPPIRQPFDTGYSDPCSAQLCSGSADKSNVVSSYPTTSRFNLIFVDDEVGGRLINPSDSASIKLDGPGPHAIGDSAS